MLTGYHDLPYLCCAPVSPCSLILPSLHCVVSPLVVDGERRLSHTDLLDLLDGLRQEQ